MAKNTIFAELIRKFKDMIAKKTLMKQQMESLPNPLIRMNHIFIFNILLLIGLLVSCTKENNGNNNDEPLTPDTPVVTHQIPSIDDFMPERLIRLFDSLNVLHRGDVPPVINNSFMSESMYISIVDKVPESPYVLLPGPLSSIHYFEFKEQEEGMLRMIFKCPTGIPNDIGYYLEKSDTDSTYYLIKDNTAFFTNDPIAPPYFKSDKFTPEDFRRAYIIGNGNYFTIYFYEVRDFRQQLLPLNAVLISGKLGTNSEGEPVIEHFWWGMETMKYYNESPSVNQLVQFGYYPTPGDIIISQCLNTLVEGYYE